MNFCPFNSLHYLNGLANIGYAEVDKNGRTVVLRRPIEGTTFFDGIGPWPYLWVNGPRDIDDLCESFRHLVTLTIVTQPGYIPKVSKGDVRFLKQHFVYDPSVPLHSLSKRSLSRLLKSEKIGTFEKVVDMEERMVIADLYKTLIKRRNLSGGFFDMPNSHFKAIAELESAVFFRVKSLSGIGAMACGVRFGDMLQVLHIVTSEYGLTWNASYLLMSNLQSYAKEQGIRLLTGGMPSSGSEGLHIFKSRWANTFQPVYMLCIVNDFEIYDKLLRTKGKQSSYFPAYRG